MSDEESETSPKHSTNVIFNNAKHRIVGGVVQPWHTLIIAPSQEMAFEFAL